mgnify:CR=1 FL=1
MVPGLIDIHMHIESSMLTPGAFCRRLAECGVTTIVSEPHEMANVNGMQGVLDDDKGWGKTARLISFYGNSQPCAALHLLERHRRHHNLVRRWKA